MLQKTTHAFPEPGQHVKKGSCYKQPAGLKGVSLEPEAALGPTVLMLHARVPRDR